MNHSYIKSADELVRRILIWILIILVFISHNGSILNNGLKILSYAVIIGSYWYFNGSLKIHIDRKKVFIIFLVALIYFVLLLISVCNSIDIKWMNITAQLISFGIILSSPVWKKIQISKIESITIVIFSTIQILTTRNSSGRSYLLSVQDPNYASWYIFLWIILLDQSKKKISALVVTILCFRTQSRNFVLCLFLYILFSRGKLLKKTFSTIVEKIKVGYVLFFIFSCLVVLCSIVYFKKIEAGINIVNISQYNNVWERFKYMFTDGSNVDRFRKYILFFNQLKEYPERYLLGYGDDVYKINVGNVPHNAFLLGYLNYGILFFPYLIIYFVFLSRKKINKTLEILFPLLLTTMFLGLGIIGMDIILIALSFQVIEFNNDK